MCGCTWLLAKAGYFQQLDFISYVTSPAHMYVMETINLIVTKLCTLG